LMELLQYEPMTDAVRPEPRAHRPRLDHEILHSRSLPQQFSGASPSVQWLHRVRDFVAKPRG
jgi:hypothetical protein